MTRLTGGPAWLCKQVQKQVAHRHVVLTIPRLLRPLLRRRRELLAELGRAAADAVSELVRRAIGDGARPGIVVSIATAGDLVQWHPHVHLLTTDAGKAADGSWQPLREWDGELLTRLFRDRLLATLVENRAISPPQHSPGGETANPRAGASPRRRARPGLGRAAAVGARLTR